MGVVSGMRCRIGRIVTLECRVELRLFGEFAVEGMVGRYLMKILRRCVALITTDLVFTIAVVE